MAVEGTAPLAPVSGKARIDILDMLRGLAILGIFFMNIPYMAQSTAAVEAPRMAGWSPLDQASWTFVEVVLEGTQRGVLEMLFGAGLMVFAARAMTPDGPVAVADLYLRRNLWLLGFGLFDIFVLLWAGDILHVYALAALFLFPFRHLGPKLLLGLGVLYALVMAGMGTLQYAERAQLLQTMQTVEQKQAARTPLTPEEKKAEEAWKKLLDQRATGGDVGRQVAAMEKAGHAGGFLAYAQMNIGFYAIFLFPTLWFTIAEAFCMMLVGIALWKWRVIQGGRSTRFYLLLMLGCYLPGMIARAVGADEMLSPVPIAHSGWITQEFARLLVSIGHVALVNLLIRAAAGRAVLAPFKAAGRMAFSLYFLQQIIGLYILFAPWGPGLWGTLSWSGMSGVAILVLAGEVVLANLWFRRFAMGPMEWAWRSLAYVQVQPFLRRQAPAAA